MFKKFTRFFTDEVYFDQAFAGLTGSARLRGALLGILVGLVTGTIPMTIFGPLAPYVWPALMFLGYATGSIQAGDKNKPLLASIQDMGHEEKTQLAEQLSTVPTPPKTEGAKP